ncbi:MAG: DoxX family protein [Patescibacteria group bacterium]|nr:DoxX family protein [Patescibacteria group bacterium]
MAELKPTPAAGIQSTPSGLRQLPLALLRAAIGWHFLYEGVVKLQMGNWSAAGYLESAVGPTAEFYHWLGANEALMPWVNLANIWGLVLVGACLMLGLFTRFACLCGMALLALYYMAYPPFFGPAVGPVEGHYLFVNKTLLEFLALIVVVAYPARLFGLDGIVTGIWAARRGKKAAAKKEDAAPTHAEAVAASMVLSRRRVLAGMAGLPVVGAFVLATLKKHGYRTTEHEQLAEALASDAAKPDGLSGATVHRFEWVDVKNLKAKPPTAKIKDLELSRLLLGGNLIGGWAHARDLIYVDKLVKAYHNEQKIFETFQIAEQCGVNALITNPVLCEIMTSYWAKTGGKMKFISDCGGRDMKEMVKKSVDTGAAACYVHGGMADSWAEKGEFDKFAEVLDLIRTYNVPAGIGGHKLETVKGCVEAGLKPDFWMKTLHKSNYWTYTEKEERDNVWCESAEETIAYMETLEEPWIAFKTMAAGAIQPKDAFRFAFESGADFVCAGMYDFQIVEDVNLAMDVLGGDINRTRPWRA